MIVLALETTCDETGAAVVQDRDRKSSGAVTVLSDIKASSALIQQKYGGVVPEMAAREQVKVMIPVVKEALERAGLKTKDLGAVAVANGPGLMGSLLIGVETAKTLAAAWGKPLIGVNHLVAHVMANWIGTDQDLPGLPAVGLVVSGGHTDLLYLETINKWEWIGGTRDDAAGEAFDKVARILGLPYPGGPAIEKVIEDLAKEGADNKESISTTRLPRPMLHEAGLEMSFSGLKAAVKMATDRKPEILGSKEQLARLAREFNEAVVEVLVAKTLKAVEIYKPETILLAGGVAANLLLRETLQTEGEKMGLRVAIPEFAYCTDNAAMIGAAALRRAETVEPILLEADPGLEIV